MAIALLLSVLAACKPPQSGPATHKLRVVSLAPGITEIMYGIGAFDLLVADSQFCDYPEEAKKLPHVGGFYEANLEAITSMRPDLVLIIDDQAVFFKDKLEKLGFRVVAVKSRTVTDVIDSIREIGTVTGRATQGNKLADDIKDKIDERIAQTKSLPRMRVLCVVDRIPGTLRDIYTAAPGSFIDGLIEASGGQNIAPPDIHGYSKIQQEAVVDADPQIIIDMVHVNSTADISATQTPWKTLPQVTAVKENRIVSIEDSFTRHPSQRMVETLDVFSRVIHPEVFGAYGK